MDSLGRRFATLDDITVNTTVDSNNTYYDNSSYDYVETTEYSSDYQYDYSQDYSQDYSSSEGSYSDGISSQENTAN